MCRRILYITTTTSMSPLRRSTLTVTSCSCRTTRRSARALPTRRFTIFARLKNGGRVGRTNETLDLIASTRRPRQAWNIRNTAAADHAWGAHATGYRMGPWPSSRGNPQNNSGMRCRSKYMAASNRPVNTRVASAAMPYRAKVSTATVSRVLNNASVVKGTTRTRVMRAVEELKYHPNLHARSLAGGKSRSIGVIVSNIENPFFLDVYKAVETGAHAEGYEVIMANTDYRSEQLVASIRLMIGRRVAGLAAIVSEMDPELIDELNGSGIPVVFYDVGAPRGNITNIRVNYRRGMETLADYLYTWIRRILASREAA